MAQSPAAILNILLAVNNLQAKTALSQTQAQLAATGKTATATGATMKKAFLGVGVAAGAAAVGIYKIGEAFDESYDTIRTKTGATGKDLEKLKKSFRDVVTAVPTDFETASKAIGELNQRLDITGRPLERITKQMTELSRITGTDIETNVQTVTRAFGDWEIQTRKQSEQLDVFFRASQESGASVAELAEQVVQFGAPLRQVGFTLDEATAMFAQFEEAGVNTQTMLPGLKFALRSFMEAGKDPQQALQKTFEGITEGTIKAKEAFEVFGGRATPDMIEAIQQGRFDLDKFTETITKHGDTIRGAGRDTMDFAEHWQKFKNQILVGLEPLAIKVFEGLGKAMEMLSKKAPQVVKDIKKAFSDVSFKQAIADMKEALRDLGPVFKFVRSVAERAFGGIKTWLQGLTQFLSGVAKFIGGVFTLDLEKAWDGVKDVFESGVKGVIGTLQFLTAPFRELAARIGHWFSEGPVADAIGWLKNALEDIVDKVKWAKEQIDGLNPFGDDELDAMVKGHQKSLTEVEKWSEHILNKYGNTHERTQRGFEDNARKVDGITKKQAAAVAGNVGNMVNAVGEGLKTLKDNTNKALNAFGVKKMSFAIESVGKAAGAVFKQRGGSINTGAPSGDSVPAMLEKGEYVLNRNAVAAAGKSNLDALNFGAAKRFQVGGLAGLQPGIARLASWAADRFGLRVSSGLRSGSGGSYHDIGAAVDLIPPSMTATKGIFGAFKSQLAELFYDPWGGYNDGQMIGPIGGHMDHIHAAILGAGGPAAGGAASLKRMLLKGPSGPLKSMGQGALDKTYSAAKRYLGKHAMTSHGGIGDISGPLQAIAQRMVESTWGAGQWPFFNDLVQRESGWDPSAVNPSSGAAGLAQALPASKYPAGAWPYAGKSSAVKQLEWMVDYISGRYGNPAGAIAWHNAHNWYQQGGEVMPSLDRGGRVTQSGLAQVHPGDVHMGKGGRPTINVYVDPVSLDVRVESIVEGMAPEIAEFTARQLGRGQGRSRQLARG